MQNLYQGGQCNPNAVASSNQFKSMMNVMTMGGQSTERVLDHAQQGVNFEQGIHERQTMFKNMQAQWGQSQGHANMEAQQMGNLMNAQFQQGMFERQRLEALQQAQWVNAQEHMKMQEVMLQQQFQKANLLAEGDMWQNEALMEQTVLGNQEQQQRIIESSTSMFDTMMSDPDPRFKDSQFLHFLNRIKSGAIVIEGKQIREVVPDSLKTMDEAWGQAEQIQASNQATMQGTFSAAQQKEYEQGLKAQEMIGENWQKRLQDYEKEYADSENFEQILEQKYMEVLKEMNLDLTDAWQSATDVEQNMVHGNIKSDYTFTPNNPYLDVAFPKKLALEMINAGKNNEAILALEAHLQKAQQDGDCWRILGRILQQNDQDIKSIPCLTNCLKYQPNNLDALLSLGVGCTNILDEVKAMNYLKKWLMLNPKYQVAGIEGLIPEEYLNEPTYSIDNIKNMNAVLIKVFEDTVKKSPEDPELFTAMAILFFIKREYEVSIDLFKRALNLDPTNYLLMNKVGATLAHLGKTDEAIGYYNAALDIRPNYVRVWVNIGIAHSFLGLYPEAVRFYLNALSFRPDVKHVWSYLHSCFMSLGRYDLIAKISSQDVRSFKDQFDVIDLSDLPASQISYPITTERHILHKAAQEWLQQFK